jgi:type I restriction enzyme M protein
MLQLNPTMKGLIAKLWNRFWSGGISNPLTAIEQITYLLFMKQLDELDLKREASGNTYTSRFSGSYRLPNTDTDIDKSTLRWSYFKKMSAEDMLPHVQQKVFPFIKDLNGDGSTFTRHMVNAVFIIPNPKLLQDAVEIIETIFIEIKREASEDGHLFQDIQGDVYEMLLNEISSAGKNGQFRTPRHIIKLISELVNPQLGHRICDPACGTAGFLLDAYQYIVTQLAIQKNQSDQAFARDEDGFVRTGAGFLTESDKNILQQSLYGFDFDSTMVRLALMNLMMHGIDNPQVDYQDTLSRSFTVEGNYDIIMANPPFTGSIDKGDINESLTINTTSVFSPYSKMVVLLELLFLKVFSSVQIMHLLKCGRNSLRKPNSRP